MGEKIAGYDVDATIAPESGEFKESENLGIDFPAGFQNQRSDRFPNFPPFLFQITFSHHNSSGQLPLF